MPNVVNIGIVLLASKASANSSLLSNLSTITLLKLKKPSIYDSAK